MNISKIKASISNHHSTPFKMDNVHSNEPFHNLNNIFINESIQNNFHFSNNLNDVSSSMLTPEFFKLNENKSLEENFPYHPKQPYIIKMPSLKKGLTKRTIQDHEKIAFRRNLCQNSYENVKQLLQCIFGKWQIGQIREITLNIAIKANLRMDRLAKRYNECLICWFCENWDIVVVHLIDYILTQQKDENNNNDSRITQILKIINNINNNFKNPSNEYDIQQLKLNQSIKEMINIDSKPKTKQTSFNFQNSETIFEDKKPNINNLTNTQTDLTDQFQNNLTNNFFFKIFNEDFNFSFDLEDEFPGLYKEFY